MTSTNLTDSSSNLDEQRLALDKARLEIELARLKLDSSFAKKWGGAPLAAGLFGLILGVFQLIVVFIQKDTEMKAASDLKLKEFQLADAERDRRSNTEAAQFVMTQSFDLSGDECGSRTANCSEAHGRNLSKGNHGANFREHRHTPAVCWAKFLRRRAPHRRSD